MAKNDLFHIIAHRGHSTYAPENTISAFILAKLYGAHYVEFDVRLTQDGVAIILHDETLARTTNGAGLIHECTYEYTQTLDAGSWFTLNGKKEIIPTLEKTIEILNKLQLNAHIELKPSRHNVIHTAEQTVSLLRKLWTHSQLPLISSFNVPCLEHALIHAPEYPRGLLLDKWKKNWHELALRVQCSGIHLNHESITPHRIKKIKDAGYMVFAYTVNHPERAKQMHTWGVDGIYSDGPQILSGN